MRPSEALAANREKVLEILGRYPVKNPRVFGSVARGEDTEDSDLDLLVDSQPSLDLFDLAALELELARVLNCRVDIGTKLRPQVREQADRELRPL